MIPRTLFEPEHEQFRRAFGTFLDREIVPHHATWEDAGSSTGPPGRLRARRASFV